MILDRQHSPTRMALTFFALALGISWAIWVPMSLFVPKDSQTPLLLLGGFGPMLAALVVARIFTGSEGMRQWLRRTFRLRIGLLWYLVAVILLPLAVALLHHGLYLFAGGESGFALDQPWVGYFVTVIIGSLIFGGNEEPGWRGFATPMLVTRFHPILASLIVGLVWVVWHLPLYAAEWAGQGQPLLWFFIYAPGLSVIMTWLFFKSKESVIPIMLLHQATNAVFQYFPRETAVLGSMDYDFSVFKAVAYWLVALVIIVATRGQLGHSPETHEVSYRTE